MSDRYTDRLSEYLDDELNAAEAAELSAHLADCPRCAAELEQLRAVRSAARSLGDVAPSRDLWPGIAEAVAARPRTASGLAGPPPELRAVPGVEAGGTAASGSRSAREKAKRVWGRRMTFSFPQLAAAAALAVLAGGAGVAVWLRAGSDPSPAAVAAGPAPEAGTPGTPAATASTGGGGAPAAGPAQAEPERVAAVDVDDPTTPPVGSSASGGARTAGGETPASAAGGARLASFGPNGSATTEVDRAVAELEGALREQRPRLDPRTVEVVDANLALIDSAIVEIRGALAKDPGSAYLNRSLASAMRRKLDVLRVATLAADASS